MASLHPFNTGKLRLKEEEGFAQRYIVARPELEPGLLMPKHTFFPPCYSRLTEGAA